MLLIIVEHYILYCKKEHLVNINLYTYTLGHLQQNEKKECSTMWSFSINGLTILNQYSVLYIYMCIYIYIYIYIYTYMFFRATMTLMHE